MRAFILFTLIALSQAKHKEVQSRYFSYGYNKDFINMTIDGSNKTHLGAMRIWNYKKIPNLSVNWNKIRLEGREPNFTLTRLTSS